MSLLDLPKTKCQEDHESTYLVSLQRIKQAHRIGAEHYQPFYDYIENHLTSKFDAKPIADFDFIKVTTGHYCKKYVERVKGKPYIRGTDLSKGTVNTDDLLFIASDDQVESKKAKKGDVVVTRVGSIGLSARIP